MLNKATFTSIIYSINIILYVQYGVYWVVQEFNITSILKFKILNRSFTTLVAILHWRC